MRIALLTNSKLSVPAISYMAEKKLLVSVGLPDRGRKTDDAENIEYTASHYSVPVVIFKADDIKTSLSNWLEECKADVVLVFTFPFRIPAQVLSIPPYGFLNFHFGLLPQYRGADAIFWQIRNMAREGGISVHRMTSRFDQGPLCLVHKIPLTPNDTYGSHLINLSLAAIPVLEKVLPALESGTLEAKEQDEALAGYNHRPTLADVTIDWSRPAAEIIALINATNPWNKGAVAYLNNYPLKIIAASVPRVREQAVVGKKAGTIISANETGGCSVSCGSEEILNLDIIFCNDSFITGNQFVRLGIFAGMQFDQVAKTVVA